MLLVNERVVMVLLILLAQHNMVVLVIMLLQFLYIKVYIDVLNWAGKGIPNA